jgi:hypothetical protein
MAEISYAAQQRLTGLLEPGEQLIWQGQPPGGFILRTIDLFLVPFSIFWSGIAAAMVYDVVHKGLGFFPFLLVPLIFLGLGIYLMAGRFFYDAWLRGRTVYGVTNERAIISWPSAVVSFELAALSEIELLEGRNGTGTIYFGRRPHPFSREGNSHWPGLTRLRAFERIENVREVFSSIRAEQRRMRREPYPA